MGNEFLDDLAIKQFINIDNEWYERFIIKKNKNYSFTNKKYDIKKIESLLRLKITKKKNFLEIPVDEFKIFKQLNNLISKSGGCILLLIMHI